MKKIALAALLCLFVSGNTLADENANPDDPCAMFLCLAGKLQGESPSECSPMFSNFMSIKKKNKHGFLPDHTASKRLDKLNSCPSADPGIISQIISKYGRLNGW